jgi:hypothetical protein
MGEVQGAPFVRKLEDSGNRLRFDFSIKFPTL